MTVADIVENRGLTGPVPGGPADTRRAQCRARVVLPTPAVPDSAAMDTASAGEPGSSGVSRRASSALRPAKAGTGGSCAGTGAPARS